MKVVIRCPECGKSTAHVESDFRHVMYCSLCGAPMKLEAVAK